MRKYKYVFVDCFDTVLLRDIPSEETKYYFAKKLVDKLNLNISAEEIYRMFASAELRLDEKNGEKYEYTFQEVLKLIYERNLAYKLGFECGEDVFIETGIDLYAEVEREHTFVNKSVISRIMRYKKKGLKLFLVSDFYCGKAFISQLLMDNNIYELFDEIFVSCDFNKSKKHSSLYHEIINKFSIKPSEIIMIGDNPISDKKVPNSIGIDSIKIKERKSSLYPKEKRKIFGTYEKVKICDSFEKIFNLKTKFGLSNYAFPLFLFIERLSKNLEKDNVKDVYFFSREGLFIKKIFDKYSIKKNLKINTYYLQVSRNAVFNASLKMLEDEDFSFINNESKKISINDFLKSLAIDDITLTSLKNEIHYDFNKKLERILENEAFKALIKNEKFILFYNNLRLSQNAGFNAYLTKNGIGLNDKLYVVDVGWKGTMQDCLYKYFNGRKTIEGYYLGYRSKKGDFSQKNIKRGLLVSDCPMMPSFSERVFEYQIMNYEQILRANHGRVAGYNVDGTIIYDESESDLKNYNDFIRELQDEIELKFDMILDANIEGVDNQIVDLTAKMFMHFNRNDIDWLKKARNSFVDAFVNVGKTVVVNSNFKADLRFALSRFKFYVKYKLGLL